MIGCMIAGTSSGCGKTTISMGIMAALKKRGLSVAPYKCGPDYIDTSFHSAITGKDSINLDTWLCSEDTVRYFYAHYGQDADIGVVEGVMGLYDGSGYENSLHSSAHIAKTLGLPVVLVLDGSGISMSAAAIVAGFAGFDSTVNIAGVIINRISSDAHFSLLKRIIEKHTHIPCIGYLPSHAALTLPDRHLGLIPACEMGNMDERIEKLAYETQKHIDLDLLMQLCTPCIHAPMPRDMHEFLEQNRNAFSGKKIAVTKDEAYHFYYRPNLDFLNMLGAELIWMSPIHDEIPPDADAYYLGGGFPEVFAAELASNASFRSAMRQNLQNGAACYAECGGLMYLCENIIVQGHAYPMAGFFPADAQMTNTLQDFGYAVLTLRTGDTIPAHEFHFSKLIKKEHLHNAYTLTRNGQSTANGAAFKNTTAGYPHIHFWGNPKAALKLFQGNVSGC